MGSNMHYGTGAVVTYKHVDVFQVFLSKMQLCHLFITMLPVAATQADNAPFVLLRKWHWYNALSYA